MTKVMSLFALAALAACVSQTAKRERYPLTHAPETVPCTDRSHCDRAWARLQTAISETSNYRIRLATDTIVETYGPISRVGGFAFKATREFAADGSGTISIRAVCAPLHEKVAPDECITDPAPFGRQMADFVRAVK